MYFFLSKLLAFVRYSEIRKKIQFTGMYVSMYVCIYVCTYVRTYVCMYVCMYVRMCACIFNHCSAKARVISLNT